MYILEVTKFGIKEYYNTKIVSKLRRQIIDSVTKYELSIQEKDFPKLRTIQLHLKELDYNHSRKYTYLDTEIRILKSRSIPKNNS